MGACLLIAVLALFAGPASASDSGGEAPDYARAGWYGGIGAIFAISDISLTTTDLGVESPPFPPDTDPEFGNSGGVDVRFGYRAFRRWAFEFDYQWQAGFDSSSSAIPFDLEIDTHLLSLNTKLFVLTERWQPYALLGASLLIFNTEIVDDMFRKPWDIDYGFAARFGAGVDYYINEHWVLTLEGTYVLAVGGLDGANMGTLGLGAQYRF
jgi:opacity protein-like surface antigen